ncbi:MAG: hypothetical protein FWC62_04820 [Firmicutes bacterium]|nr:hypothetical protein [Bacillota bacterium]
MNRALYRKLVSLCKERDIPYQTEVLAGHSGTDAWAVQVSREGGRTALISPPIRYMHSPVETIDLRDTARCAELLAAFCEAYGDES